MPAKDILGGNKEKSPVVITTTSGYVDTPVPKRCGTCEYIQGKKFCTNKTVLKDKQIKTDPDNGLKVISAANGCCNEWEPK